MVRAITSPSPGTSFKSFSDAFSTPCIPPKMGEQITAAFWTQSRNHFQYRRATFLVAFGTVFGNGKTVCFIAYLLNQMQGFMVFW